MNFLWRALYNIILVPLFLLSARIYMLFNSKARAGLRGRRGMFDRLSEQVPLGSDQVAWFHCASVGELEQAKPIIAALDGAKASSDVEASFSTPKKAKVVISVFSPSGYDAAAKYPGADLVCYIPLDSARNARRMFQLINPTVLIFVRFDVWPNHVWEAVRRQVPVMLVDASLHERSKRLWPVARSFLKSVHRHINLHCAISDTDAQRLKRICPKNTEIRVTGDTRFDQVIARSGSASKKLEGLLPQFSVPVIIAGSTYVEDEKVVIDAYQKVLERWGDVQLILVPHEPETYRLEEIDALMSQRDLPYVLLSQVEKGMSFEGEASGSADILPVYSIVVDRVGVLAELYMLGDITFIGGSFHGSVHNVMEPAVMGKPVLFGPTIHNSLEALMLKERGAGIMINDGEEMAAELIKLLTDDKLREKLGNDARSMIEESAGATEKIVSCIGGFLESSDC